MRPKLATKLRAVYVTSAKSGDLMGPSHKKTSRVVHFHESDGRTEPACPPQSSRTINSRGVIAACSTRHNSSLPLSIVIHAKARDYVFTGVGLFVCLSVTTITK